MSNERAPQWDGPLFYPPHGYIAVMNSGERIEVWPNESEAGCFTGLLLKEGRTYSQRVVFDMSCLWDRTQIYHIEVPTPPDLSLMEYADSVDPQVTTEASPAGVTLRGYWRLTGKIDRQALRVDAVYRLMARRGLGKKDAIRLMEARGVKCARGTVELWLAHPLKNQDPFGFRRTPLTHRERE